MFFEHYTVYNIVIFYKYYVTSLIVVSCNSNPNAKATSNTTDPETYYYFQISDDCEILTLFSPLETSAEKKELTMSAS